ncbi:MAG: hypothetical protein QOE33_2402 [Acidobacteriota bacterium]|nr:hypothetical protein [Acidobacteriota bacterium]
MAEKSVSGEGEPSVSSIFRRAQALRVENPQLSLKDLRARIVREFRGGAFPSLATLTIPEQDARAPEEDWTAGLSLVRRGIQNEDWEDLATGIALSLEQTDNYERQRGFTGAVDEWHDRTVGIREPLTKGIGKWMPEELKRIVSAAEKKLPGGDR